MRRIEAVLFLLTFLVLCAVAFSGCLKCEKRFQQHAKVTAAEHKCSIDKIELVRDSGTCHAHIVVLDVCGTQRTYDCNLNRDESGQACIEIRAKK